MIRIHAIKCWSLYVCQSTQSAAYRPTLDWVSVADHVDWVSAWFQPSIDQHVNQVLIEISIKCWLQVNQAWHWLTLYHGCLSKQSIQEFDKEPSGVAGQDPKVNCIIMVIFASYIWQSCLYKIVFQKGIQKNIPPLQDNLHITKSWVPKCQDQILVKSVSEQHLNDPSKQIFLCKQSMQQLLWRQGLLHIHVDISYMFPYNSLTPSLYPLKNMYI